MCCSVLLTSLLYALLLFNSTCALVLCSCPSLLLHVLTLLHVLLPSCLQEDTATLLVAVGVGAIAFVVAAAFVVAYAGTAASGQACRCICCCNCGLCCDYCT